LIALSAVVDFY